jgi:hypothetical protein
MPTIGLLGLPGSGKSTVFHALTRQAVAPQFIGYDLKPNHAVVKIPDPHLDWLAAHYQPKSVVHAALEFVDIPGFDPKSTEQKLKNAVLEHYRRCDALALVVNLFHMESAERAARGVQALLDELALVDLVNVERACHTIEKAAKLKADHEAVARHDLLSRIKTRLEEGAPLHSQALTTEEEKHVRDLAFLSAKPVLCVLNIAEDAYSRPDEAIAGLMDVLNFARSAGIATVRFAASLEAALVDMSEEEAAEYMAEFAVSEPALPRFIRAAYDCLDLITFYTTESRECRAWPLRRGLNAQQAAGVIHSDMARGFIRAETVRADDLVQYGSLAAARHAGKVRLEGKEYVVADGDVLLIRFNV